MPETTLLIHDLAAAVSPPTTADHFGALADVIKKRGYRFITLEEALKDKAYFVRVEDEEPRIFGYVTGDERRRCSKNTA